MTLYVTDALGPAVDDDSPAEEERPIELAAGAPGIPDAASPFPSAKSTPKTRHAWKKKS